MLVKTLIDEAGKRVGTRYKLARLLDVPLSKVYDWQAGRAICTPADQARIAALTTADPVNQLIQATIDKYAGTIRGAQLKAALEHRMLSTPPHRIFEQLQTATDYDIARRPFADTPDPTESQQQTMN